MFEQGDNRAERLSLARAQALKASVAEGAGFVGAMHWQAAHIPGPLRALKDREQRRSGRRSPPPPGHWCRTCRPCVWPSRRAAEPSR